MINRARQNWPQEYTTDLLERVFSSTWKDNHALKLAQEELAVGKIQRPQLLARAQEIKEGL